MTKATKDSSKNKSRPWVIALIVFGALILLIVIVNMAATPEEILIKPIETSKSLENIADSIDATVLAVPEIAIALANTGTEAAVEVVEKVSSLATSPIQGLKDMVAKLRAQAASRHK